MLIVKLMGGLGNQMFQYALGRTLCDINGYELFLDTSCYSTIVNDKVRQYKLDNFDIRATIATTKDLSPYQISKMGSVVNNILGTKLFSPEKPAILEANYRYDKNIINTTDDNYLSGYWQSEKYFLQNKRNILKDFTYMKPLSSYSNSVLKKSKAATASVSVHVRRGDYVTSKDARDFHGQCNKEYYDMSAELISRKIGKVEFFVFSDDIKWASENILKGFANVHYIHNKSQPKSDIEELILMSKCKHNIIANSTFSWWGAWLNTHKDKIVISPKEWFKDSKIDTVDIIPNSWLRI